MNKRLYVFMLIACVWSVLKVQADTGDIVASLHSDPDVESVKIGNGVLKNVFKDAESDIEYIGIFNSRNMRGVSRMHEVIDDFTAAPEINIFATTECDDSSMIMYGLPAADPDRYAAIVIVNRDGNDMCVIFIAGDILLSDLVRFQQDKHIGS